MYRACIISIYNNFATCQRMRAGQTVFLWNREHNELTNKCRSIKWNERTDEWVNLSLSQSVSELLRIHKIKLAMIVTGHMDLQQFFHNPTFPWHFRAINEFLPIPTPSIMQSIVKRFVNSSKGRVVKCYTLPSRSNLHFYFLTFGHCGAQAWASECPKVRN